MFSTVLKHEMKNIRRDKMYAFFAIFSLVMIVLAYFLVPYLNDTASTVVADLATLFFLLMNSFMFGAITGFTLLDDQDDNVILSLKITPISVKNYVFMKLLISYLFGIFATLGIILATPMVDTTPVEIILMIIILSPLQSPIIALIVNMFASNKVEGFVMMKLSGIILMGPIAVLFLTDWKEIFLMILPGFWVSRIISMELMPLNYLFASAWVYFILGLIVNLGIIYLFFNIYQKRVHI